MTRWEYWVHRYVGDTKKIEQVLNELGAEGWELVTVDEESIFYLKRGAGEADPASTPSPDSQRFQVRL